MFHPRQPRSDTSLSRRILVSLPYLFAGLVLILGSTAHAQRPLGIDVSHWQGTGINWTSVKNSGRSFAWCKASEGTGYTDNTFVTNQVNAKAAGVLVGAYHFARYDQDLGIAGAEAEAQHFWNVAKNYIKNGGTYLMPVLDAENVSSTSGPSQAGYTKTTFSQWVNAWATNLVATAASNGVVVKPVLYTGTSFASTWLNSTVTNNFTPWLASWNGADPTTGSPSATSPWSTWVFWQYTDAASVTGAGTVDGDVFNGTSASIYNYVIGGANAPYILSQPSSRTADRGGSLTMSVSAGGAATLKYQWRLNGTNISAATTSALTRTNIQTTNAGNYTVVITNTYGAVTSSVAVLTVNGLFTPVFSDNFDTNSSSAWTLNRSSTDTRAIFAYDHSVIGVPTAPNSGGTTKALRFEANLSAAATAALNVSPIGKSFGGNYRLHFDMWINVNGPLPDGGTGSTEAITAGLGTAGNRTQWNGTGSTADGVWFEVDGEGGSSDTSTTQGDFVAYIGTNQQSVASGVYLAGTDTSARSDGDSYYQNVFPGGQTPPASQKSSYAQQTGSLNPGTVGFAWRDVVINKSGSTVEWFIDGLKIATVSGSSITSSNVFVGYWDPYTSVSDNTNLSFGLIDNLRVEVPVVAPTISAQPQNLTVNQGANATFAVTATGTPTPSYQWRFNGTNIAGATASSYTQTNVVGSDAGSYSVVVTNVGGSVTSSNAVLAVNVPPTITSQPVGLTVNAGSDAAFSASATGAGPLVYQWRLNGSTIFGATNNTYSLTNVQAGNAGNYSLVVSNNAGFVVSSNALLTVVQMQFDPALITLSNGALQFAINGAPGTEYFLEASSNLVEWIPVATLTNINGTVQFAEPLSTNTPDRFYRVSAPR